MEKTSMYINKFLINIILIFLHYFIEVSCQGCGCAPAPSPELVFLDQRLAVVYPVIQTFKATITSDTLNKTKSWVGPDICSYEGFYCDKPPDNLSATALAGIDFNGFQLAAPTLDGFINLLPDLAFFHANTNNFSASIPANISQLRYFYELDISNNQFLGNFPMEVLGIKDLTFLDIRFNSFTGTVPATIFSQNELEVLFINNNNFNQKLPDNVFNSPVLYLTLANNRFSSPIPRSIGNASTSLIEVLLLNNFLYGCIPYEIGLLQNLTVFDADNNLLTGPLPCSLGCLEKIEQLRFAGNFLYGQIPEVVCSIGTLLNLSLSDNYFNYAGPICRKRIRSGVLDVRNNCIPGQPEQRSKLDCHDFYWQLKPCNNHYWFDFLPCKVHPLYVHSPAKSTTNSITYPVLERHML